MKKIKSYTGIWNVEKVLYAINDFNLPFPVTFSEIASHGNCTPRPFQKKASDPRSDPRATVGKVVLPRPILTE